MSPEALSKLCLAFTGAEATRPFGPEVTVFKVCAKMFALSDLDAEPLKVNLKCDPDLAEALRAEFQAVQPGYHMNKRHWNTVTIGSDLDDQQIKQQIEDSYDLIVKSLKKSDRERLQNKSST